MKKFKTLLATLLALSIPVSAASLAACNSGNDDAHKCGHVCTTCNKCTSDCTDEVCKDKCEGHETDATPITDGVYQRLLQGSYVHKIKLYENGTFYFEDAMKSNVAKGTYEVKENEQITYAQYDEADGTVTENGDWVTVTTKVVYFKNADGTPFTVNRTSASADAKPSKSPDTGYKYGTPSNALALIDGKFVNALMGTYTRTLVQTNIDFDIDDEQEIEQQKLMVKELPSGAPAGKTVQDYYISISQNGFKSYITGEEVLGSYTYANNVYTLSNTITGESFGTLTIGADGAATYRNGSTTIELETWAEAQHTAVATLTGSKTLTTSQGDTPVTFTLTLYDNVTCVLTNSMSDQLNVEGTWLKNDSGYTINLTGWTVTSATVSGENLTVVCGGSLGSATITDLSLTGKVEEEAVTNISYMFEGTAMSVITVKAYLYDDGAVLITGYNTMSKKTSVIAAGTWERPEQGFPTVTLTDSEKTATVSLDGSAVVLTLHADLGDGTAKDYKLSKLDDLTTAATASYTFEGTAMSVITVKAYLYDDGAVLITGYNTMSKKTSVVAVGTWERPEQGFPTVTLTDSEKTATVSLDGSAVVLTLHADLGDGTAKDYKLSKID